MNAIGWIRFSMFQSPRKQIHKLVIAALMPVAVVLSSCSSREEKAQSYYEDGMKRLAEHDNGRANIEFRNAIKNNKNLLPAWKALAQLEEQNKNLGALIPILNGIVELQPDDIQTKLKLARLLALTGLIDEALALVNSAEVKDAQNAEVLSLKAILLFKLKDYDGAVHEAQASLAINPANPEAVIVLAAEQLERGDAKAALTVLNSNANTATDNNLSLLLFKLKVIEQIRDLGQAESLLKKLIGLYPDELEFHKQLIKIYVAGQRPDDAEKESRSLADAHPADVKLRLELVELLYAIRSPAKAREELVSSIAADKDSFAYQIALAKLDYAQGDFANASKQLQSLIDTAKSPDNLLTALEQLAEMYLGRKDMERAGALVADILAKDSHNIAGLRLRAGIHMEEGKPELAVDDLRQALSDQPNSPQLMSLLASAYDRSGLIELAEKQFADATAASKYDPQIGLVYVEFLERRGNISRAEDVAQELSNRWPQNIQVLSLLGDIHLARQNWAGAQEVADSIRRIGNDHGSADRLLGAALSGRNKFDDSVSALERAYSTAPADGQSLGALVRAYIKAKKTDRAVAFLQNLLIASPANAEALVYLGSIQRINNTPDEAKKSFMTAIAKQPKNVIGYSALADLYLSQKKPDEALATIQAGLAQVPENPVLLLVSAGIEERKGDYLAAIQQYEHVLEKQPGSLVAVNNLASLLADHSSDKNDLDRARSLAAMLRQSPVPQFKDTLGWVTYQAGEARAAIPLLEAAVSALPDQSLVHYHLGMTYVATGATDKAAEQLNLAMKQATDESLKEKIRAALKKLPT